MAQVPARPIEPRLEFGLQRAHRAAPRAADGDLGLAGGARVDVQQRALGRVLRDEELVAGVPLVVVDPPGDRVPDREEVQVLLEHRRVEGGERGDVVGDPDTPAVGPEDQVVLAGVNREVIHRHRRNLAADPVPVRPAVQRHVHPELAAGHQEVLVVVVLADHVQRGFRRQGPADRAEAVPVVVAQERVGGVVVVPVPVEGYVDPRRRVRRGNEPGHVGPVGDSGQISRQVVPGRAAVPAPLEIAVVGAHVDDARFDRGHGDRHDLAEARDPVVARKGVVGDRDIHDRQLVPVEALGEVVGAGPGVAAVRGDEEPVPAVEHGARIVR